MPRQELLIVSSSIGFFNLVWVDSLPLAAVLYFRLLDFALLAEPKIK
jgi:hypothetical protein